MKISRLPGAACRSCSKVARTASGVRYWVTPSQMNSVAPSSSVPVQRTGSTSGRRARNPLPPNEPTQAARPAPCPPTAVLRSMLTCWSTSNTGRSLCRAIRYGAGVHTRRPGSPPRRRRSAGRLEPFVDKALAAGDAGPQPGPGPLRRRDDGVAHGATSGSACTSARRCAGRKAAARSSSTRRRCGWLVVLDRRQHHRPEGRLRRRVPGHQRLLTYPASTGSVTPVT